MDQYSAAQDPNDKEYANGYYIDQRYVLQFKWIAYIDNDHYDTEYKKQFI